MQWEKNKWNRLRFFYVFCLIWYESPCTQLWHISNKCILHKTIKPKWAHTYNTYANILLYLTFFFVFFSCLFFYFTVIYFVIAQKSLVLLFRHRRILVLFIRMLIQHKIHKTKKKYQCSLRNKCSAFIFVSHKNRISFGFLLETLGKRRNPANICSRPLLLCFCSVTTSFSVLQYWFIHYAEGELCYKILWKKVSWMYIVHFKLYILLMKQ